MRRYFKDLLFNEMSTNKDIVVLTGDLGFGMFDKIRDTFTNRFINCGASEQAMMDMAVGLALAGKIPVVYSITPFLLWRTAETIRTYINHEKLNVKLIGGGRGHDYEHDGFSHDAQDDIMFMEPFENIKCFWPEDEKDLDELLQKAINDKSPYYINLKR